MTASDSSPPRVVVPREIKLRGETLTLRQLGPADATRLQEFFYSHSFETIQMRYGHAVTRMTPERAFDLVNVDQSRDLAIALFEMEGPRQIIHAVGRYYLDPDGRSAEVAFVVRESKRRHGIGTLLLQTLVDVARARSLEALWGRVRRDNAPMLALFRRFGALVVPAVEANESDVEVRIMLHPAKAVTAEKKPVKRSVSRILKKRGIARSSRSASP